MSCSVGHRHSLDLVLLWLRHRLAAAALIQALAWEPPYVMGVAVKRKKKILARHFLQTLPTTATITPASTRLS